MDAVISCIPTQPKEYYEPDLRCITDDLVFGSEQDAFVIRDFSNFPV
jgi:hypothetical protein